MPIKLLLAVKEKGAESAPFIICSLGDEVQLCASAC